MFDRWAWLFTPEVFRSLPAVEGPGAERRAYLREFLAVGIEGHRTRDLQDRLLREELAGVADVDGEEIPYRRLPVRIRREPDRARRAALEGERARIVRESLNPVHADALAAVHEVAGELGGTDYDAWCAELAGLDFDALEERTAALLEETADVHADLLRWFAGRALDGVRIDELETHDLARMLYGAEYLDGFPGDGMVGRLTRPILAMGIDPTAGGRIELDLEERPTKTPRAFCAPVRVPDDVKLVLQPYGGYDDYTTFLHELGHALHYAHVEPDLPMEFRRLGDNGVTEAFAMTLDHLMQLPEFLERALEVGDAEEFLRFQAFREIVMVRRYAAKFAYERSLHREGAGPGRADEYVERLTAATGARPPRELYLEDVDPHYYCVRYLRAWMLAGHLHRALRERFDVDWFLNPRTGPFLREMWALGQARPAEALARERLDDESLGFGPLMEMVLARV